MFGIDPNTIAWMKAMIYWLTASMQKIADKLGVQLDSMPKAGQ